MKINIKTNEDIKGKGKFYIEDLNNDLSCSGCSRHFKKGDFAYFCEISQKMWKDIKKEWEINGFFCKDCLNKSNKHVMEYDINGEHRDICVLIR